MSERWPDDCFDALVENYRAGLSYRENAEALNARFGTRYTRHAAQGKIDRTVRRAKPAPLLPTAEMPPERLARLQRVARWDSAARNALFRYQRSLA